MACELYLNKALTKTKHISYHRNITQNGKNLDLDTSPGTWWGSA